MAHRRARNCLLTYHNYIDDNKDYNDIGPVNNAFINAITGKINISKLSPSNFTSLHK
jgi:hypothetical protein